jgi:hypothetical protein
MPTRGSAFASSAKGFGVPAVLGFSAADPMDVRITNANRPNLRRGDAFTELMTGLEFVGIDRQLSGLDVDRCELTLVASLELRLDCALIQRVAAAREFFFAVAAFH